GSSVFFVLAPGFIAGVVPWWLTGWRMREPWPGALAWPIRIVGAGLIVAGAAVVVQAFARFVNEGLGTPAPVAPPERLVVGGLYRHVRNPMYVAVTTAILGQALLLGQPVLFVLAAAVWLAMAAFVRWYEEPTLCRRYGAQYDAYRRAVPAWIPRLTPARTPQDQSGQSG
ncbi:MAG: methyltransferase family protein, partial [Micromonosporaceae bacterium]